jgi:two-component system response regulator DevR
MKVHNMTVTPDMKRIRLLLVDDHEMVRVGLRTMLEESGEVSVIGEAGTAADAVTEAVRLNPDLVLMDVRLPDGSGAEACSDIRNVCPEIRVLFLTSFADDLAVMTTVAGGAQGYVLKEIGREALIRAIKTVADGHSILDPSVTKPIIARMRAAAVEPASPEKESLSSQERRVLALVAEGKTNKEIAAELNLSDKTVKNYLSHAFQKLHVARRSQAAALFTKRSL